MYKRLSQLKSAFRYSIWGLFGALNAPLWQGFGYEKTSSRQICLAREERARSRTVTKSGLCVGLAGVGYFVPEDTELRRLFCWD